MFSNTAHVVRGTRFNNAVSEGYLAYRNEISLWRISGAIRKGKTGIPGGKKNCSSAAFTTTNSTWTALESNPESTVGD